MIYCTCKEKKKGKKEMKKITFDEFIDYMEDKGFSCNGYNNGAYEFETYSDAGCDIIITVSSKETAVKDIAENAESFDIDEFVRGWLNAKEHGTNGVPDASTLVRDAESMKEMFDALAYETSKFEIE